MAKNNNEKSDKEVKKFKVTHVLADGTIRDNMKGYKVPFNQTTEPAYRILAKF